MLIMCNIWYPWNVLSLFQWFSGTWVNVLLGFFPSSDSLILCIPLASVIITFLTLITVFIFTRIKTLNQKQRTKLDYEYMVMCKIHLFFFHFFTGKKEEDSKNKKRAISHGSWGNQQGLWWLCFQCRGLLHLFLQRGQVIRNRSSLCCCSALPL